MKNFGKTLLLIVFYLLVFVAAFGIMSFYLKVEVLPNLNWQLYAGGASLLLAGLLLIPLFKNDAEDVEDTKPVEKTAAPKVETIEEYTPIIEETKIIENVVEDTDSLENELVEEATSESVVEEFAEEAQSVEEETVEEATNVVEETVNEVEETIENTTEEIIEEANNVVEETVEEVNEVTEEINETVDEVVEELAEISTLENPEVVDHSLETILNDNSLVTGATGEFVNSVLEEIHSIEKGEEEVAVDFVPLVTNEEIKASDLSVESDTLTESVEETTSEVEEENVENVDSNEELNDEVVVEEAVEEQEYEESTKAPTQIAEDVELTETQVMYIEKSDNSYINTVGMPQLVMTEEISTKAINDAKELAVDDPTNNTVITEKGVTRKKTEADYEEEEKNDKLASVLGTIAILLLVAILAVGGYYFWTRMM